MNAVPHQHAFPLIPLAYLAAAFALGVLSIPRISVGLGPILLLAASASFMAFIALLRNRLRLAAGSTCLTMVLLGAASSVLQSQEVGPDRIKRLLEDGTIKAGEPVEITGVVKGTPEYGPENLYLTLQTEAVFQSRSNRRVSGIVAVSLPLDENTAAEYEMLELRYGARLRLMTRLERADNYRNPGVSSFTEYLDQKGYDATAFVKSPLLIERLDDARVFLPLAWLYEWRRSVLKKINATFAPETAGVLSASLLGNRHSLSRSSAERFREGGTFHVLVISGLHISFIGGVILLLTRRLTRSRKAQFGVSVVILWGYSLAVGAQASVVRAAFMFTFVTFASMVSRRAASLNALGAAALVLLVLRPSELFDPSFQLTFLSVAAIVGLAWPLLERMSAIGSWRPTREAPYPPIAAPWLRALSEVLFWSERRWRNDLERSTHGYRLFKSPVAAHLEQHHLQPVLRYTFTALVVSLSVQLTLLPLLIVYFHRLSLASLVLNIGVSVLMAVMSIVGLLALVVSILNVSLAAPFIWLADGLNWLMMHSVDPFVSLGVSSVRIPEYAGWFRAIYVLYYAPFVIITALLARWNPLVGPPGERKRWRTQFLLIVMQVTLLLLVVFHPWSASPGEGKLRIDFLDVGQGDAAMVTMPDGSSLLIDAGGRPNFRTRFDGDAGEGFERDSRSVGEAVVSEYLWHRGFDSVDYLLATHADSDHMSGLNDIAQNFRVRAALVGRTPAADAEYSKFVDTMEARAVHMALVRAGDLLRFGNVTAEILWPPFNSNAGAPSRNNDSVVLKLKFGERAILLTGDIESETESTLVRLRQDLTADVVKVAHHGSKSSSTDSFVGAVKARWAIISVGQTSIFEHPHPQVVERWKSSGAEVLTTGNRGAITVTTDGYDLGIETFVRR